MLVSRSQPLPFSTSERRGRVWSSSFDVVLPTPMQAFQGNEDLVSTYLGHLNALKRRFLGTDEC